MVAEPSGLDAHATFERLREVFFRYYDTPFGLADRALQRERGDLLDRDGGVWRTPLLELRPQYQTTGRSLQGSCAVAGAPTELAELAAAGLVPPGVTELYTHQELALRLGQQRGQHQVITAGTGAGKTEAFLLPLLASLLEESREWSGQPASSSNAWWESGRSWMAQRSGETGRQAAVRAIVMYPMNALVDDQLVRLRRALDSDAARLWLDENRQGHRFYFGRYTGATPVTGAASDQRAVSELRKWLTSTADRGQRARDLGGEAAYFVPRLDGAEMRSRWDMVAHPPDVLITNYSMLNVLLLRERDAVFFDNTRKWLESSPDHRFTLVVDELHSYRGTAGTEIALLLRNLRQRLGLRGDSGQLRILAASASLEPGRDLTYLEEFFGAPADRFAFVPGDPVRPSGSADLSAHAAVLAAAEPGNELEVADGVGAADALRAAFYTREGGVPAEYPEAQTERRLAEAMFPSSGHEERAAAGRAVLAAAGRAADKADWPRLRAHLFFRNVAGMWACTDPSCPDAQRQPGDDTRTVGRLYAQPATRCSCGARVLELLYCQDCGDVLLGGFVPSYATQVSSGSLDLLLLADVPELAKLPDQVLLERTAANYLVYWPRAERPMPDPLEWDEDRRNVHCAFRRCELTPASGRLRTRGQNQAHTGWVWQMTSSRSASGWAQEPAKLSAMPLRCPSCAADWVVTHGPTGWRPYTDSLRQRSPVRTMRTGFEKINQVLITELASQLGESQRKLVTFTDSRQDAAKLSAGLALRHYQDLLRELVYEEASDQADPSADLDAARRYVVDRDRTLLAVNARNRLRERHSAAWEALFDIWDEAPDAQLDRELALRAQLSAPLSLTDLASRVSRTLLSLGINPGGPKASLQVTAPRDGAPWSSLWNWPTGSTAGPVSPPPRTGSDTQESLRSKLEESLNEEVAQSLASGAGRDVESLGLGWLACTTDSLADEQPTDGSVAFGRASLRVLAEAKRFMGLRRGVLNAPSKLRKFWSAVADYHGISVMDVETSCRKYWGNAVVDYLIKPEAVQLRTAGPTSWTCTNCRRQHLHPGAGVCTRCRQKLPEAEARQDGEDYYRWKAATGQGRFRLACAELTGQTDRVDAQSRQSRFQGVFLNGQENPMPDGLDLLSVTTTMEAGVDIGALEAVVLANMPPSRFNYQQRVGRAGRRGSPVAVALTVCRGRSHDEYYFSRPERITNEPTPPPYLALGREEIYQRVLAAELLRQAFSDLGPALIQAGMCTELTNNPHGQFGLAADWTAMRAHVVAWIQAHSLRASATAAALAERGPSALRERDWPRWCVETLPASIDAAVVAAGHNELSQRLAEAGVLPMFGFPTRVRHLYLERPRFSFPWPPGKAIDREVGIALSQFSPLSEVVRDGTVHGVVGITSFKPTRGEPAVGEAFGTSRHLETCDACAYIGEAASGALRQPSCPRCGAAGDEFRVADVREPLGFRAGPGEDFDGTFSWSARAMAARAATDTSQLARHTMGAAVALSGRGTRFVVNDNNRKLFRLRPASEARWGGYISLSAVEVGKLRPDAGTGDPIDVALGIAQTTDFLFLSPRSPVPTGTGLRLNLPAALRQPSGAPDLPDGRRAAWYSLAFLLRTAGAAQLDIQPSELAAGLYSGRGDAGPVTHAFVADTLENGAGFATHLGSQSQLTELIARMQGLVAEFAQPGHAARCSASCYECLRDYANMAYHALLDWRLAADLLAVLLGQALPDRSAEERAVVAAWAQAYGAVVLDGLPVAAAEVDLPQQGHLVLLARHPLEGGDTEVEAPRIALARQEVAARGADAVVVVDTVVLDRSPGHVIALADY